MLGQDAIHPENIVTCQIRLRLGNADQPIPSAEQQQGTKEVEEEAESFEFDEDGVLIEHEQSSSPRLRALEPLVNPNPPVHAPHFPVDKRPSWWVILCTADMSSAIVPPIRLHDMSGRRTVPLQFPAPHHAGAVKLAVLVRSDSLLGTDQERKVVLTITPRPASKDGKETSEEEDWGLTSGSDSAAENPFFASHEHGEHCAH